MSFIKRQWKRFKETAGYWLVNPLGLLFSESGRAVVNRQIASERLRKAGNITPGQRLDILTSKPLSGNILPTQTHSFSSFNASGQLTPSQPNAVLGSILANFERFEVEQTAQFLDDTAYLKQINMDINTPVDRPWLEVSQPIGVLVDNGLGDAVDDDLSDTAIQTDPVTGSILESTGLATTPTNKTAERLALVGVGIALISLIFKR